MITKKGKVTGIKKGKLLVSVDNTSACAGCHQKAACLLTDCKVKILEVEAVDVSSYKEGQEVDVCLEESMAGWAVFFAFILPLVLLVASVGVLMFLTKNEMKSASFAIVLMLFYYFCLFLCRKKLAKKFRLTVGDK